MYLHVADGVVEAAVSRVAVKGDVLGKLAQPTGIVHLNHQKETLRISYGTCYGTDMEVLTRGIVVLVDNVDM